MSYASFLKTFASGVVVYAAVACSSAMVAGQAQQGIVDGGASSSSGGNDPGRDAFGGDAVPSAHADDATSGTRLVVRHIQGADGSSMPYGLFDTQLNVPCSFATASDGKLRCLPTGLPVPAGMTFTDPSCTSASAVPIIAAHAACPPAYGIEVADASNSCGTTTTIHQLEPISAGYVVTPNGCAPMDGDAFFKVGATIDPSTFVQGDVK